VVRTNKFVGPPVLSGRNVLWPRRMLPHVSMPMGQTDGRTRDRDITGRGQPREYATALRRPNVNDVCV